MNVALPAVILFLLAVPGYLLRSQFSRPERTAPDSTPFGRILGSSILLALPLNALWAWLAEHVSANSVDWPAFLMLVAGTRVADDTFFVRATQSLDGLFVYLFSLCLFAWLLGYLSRELIQKLDLDRRYRALRMDAPWYYLFTCRLDDAPEPDAVILSAVVEIAGEAYIYMGRLDSVYYTPEGQPERFVLSNVSRRRIADDRSAEGGAPERFYAIDGDYFVLRYAETKTLNVFYWCLPAPAADPQPEAVASPAG